MNGERESVVDEVLRDAAAIGVGAAILGLRRLNITRREVAERVPASRPLIDATLDGIETVTPAISEALGALVTTAADAVPGCRGEQLRSVGTTIAVAGPELLRLSGLTAR